MVLSNHPCVMPARHLECVWLEHDAESVRLQVVSGFHLIRTSKIRGHTRREPAGRGGAEAARIRCAWRFSQGHFARRRKCSERGVFRIEDIRYRAEQRQPIGNPVSRAEVNHGITGNLRIQICFITAQVGAAGRAQSDCDVEIAGDMSFQHGLAEMCGNSGQAVAGHDRDLTIVVSQRIIRAVQDQR